MVDAINQEVWKGYEALRTLGKQAPVPGLKSAAKDLHDKLARSARGGPIVAFIATRGEGVAPDDVVEAMNRFVEQAEKSSSSYEQPAFQCLSDFRKEQAAGHSRLLAGFTLAICLAACIVSIKVGG